MKFRSKSYLFIGVVTLILVIVSTLASLYAARSYSLISARDQGQMAANLVLTTLTEEMLSGNMERHEPLLDRLNTIPGIKSIEVFPSEVITQQYGHRPEDVHEPGPLERQVLETGQAAEGLDEHIGKVILSIAIPYIASAKGSVNCLACHDVGEGTVLGVVRSSIDLTAQRRAGAKAILVIIALLLLFGGIMAWALKKLLNPIVHSTNQLQAVVESAEEGVYSGQFAKRETDESDDVAKLLRRTVGVVANVIEAAHFKRAIENDRDLNEVYTRIQRVLKEHFGLSRFSVYEVNNSKNRLKLIFAEGLHSKAELWCDPEVLIQGDACRAKRTAQCVSSIEEDGICPAFAGNRGKEKFLHICIPIMLGGSIGGVLQLAFTHSEEKRIQKKCANIQTYLHQAAPVIEAKRLMQSLKESTLRDPMTGLYNRRFLEEYIEMLMATVERRKTSMAVLMCDMDFFKQVNDTLGHETGDAVLKGAAEILKQSVRASDLIIRYGGEEFLALLVDASEEKAMEIAKRMRASMEAHAFPTASGPLTKTLSIGVSMYPADNTVFWDCVKHADIALYQAKERGRNQVLRFTKDMWKEDDQA